DLCHFFFANPDQADQGGNDRGDRCERQMQGVITRFKPSRWVYPSQGQMTACVGQTYDVNVRSEGSWWATTPQGAIIPLEESQRFTVGACECTQLEIDLLECNTVDNCPKTQEKNVSEELAYKPIAAGDSLGIPYIHDAVPSAPWTLSTADIPYMDPGFPIYVINKHAAFSHMPGANEKRFNWDWQCYNPSVAGLHVETRVAWQEPEINSYEYQNNNTLDYSDHREEMHYSCYSWPSTWNLFNLMAPLVWQATQPWGAADLPDVSPYPYALLRDAASADRYLVTYGYQMQATEIRKATYSPGAISKLQQEYSAVASAIVDTTQFGVPMSEAPVIFQYGGREPDWEYSTALWIGFPTHEANLWLRAEEIYGPQAAEGPLVSLPKMVYHARGNRLIVVGDKVTKLNGMYQIGTSHIWTFDLMEGRWKHVGRLDGGMVEKLSFGWDPLRNRAVVYGGKKISGQYQLRVYNFDLDTLQLSEMATTPSVEGPGGILFAGAFLEPLEQALYAYGGREWVGGQWVYNTKAFRLDLLTRQWSYLGDGAVGPGARSLPFVTYDRVSSRLWVSGGEIAAPEPGVVVYWGLKDGEWIKHTTLQQRDVSDWTVEGTFGVETNQAYPVYVPETTAWPGPLLTAHLESSDPSLGLEVMDSEGNLVGQDLTANTDKYVSFYAHSIYVLRVVPGPGYDPATNPTYTITLSEVEPTLVGNFAGTAGVNDLMVHGDVAYLVGTSGMDAVSLANPTAPQAISHLDLGGHGQAIAMCGSNACVSHAHQGDSLRTVDISDPAAMQLLGQLQTPGLSRSLGVKAKQWAYLSDSGAGVSILDVRDPANPLLVDRLTLPGVVTSVAVGANRLYVANRPQHEVRIYDITDSQSPMLLGSFDVADPVEAMLVRGTSLHVAEHTGNGWQGCQSGQHCPRGTQVEVYDISDPSDVAKVAEYDGEQNPVVHLRPYRSYGLVRSYDGFAIYQLEPTQ
ncbi:LVIVD repeat-containing protein, partial [Myxococcota bacterium]